VEVDDDWEVDDGNLLGIDDGLEVDDLIKSTFGKNDGIANGLEVDADLEVDDLTKLLEIGNNGIADGLEVVDDLTKSLEIGTNGIVDGLEVDDILKVDDLTKSKVLKTTSCANPKIDKELKNGGKGKENGKLSESIDPAEKDKEETSCSRGTKDVLQE
jgi:hypothetical protein